MRRLFRRHIRQTLSENVPPILQKANFVFDKGEYGRTAELFERLAQTADSRGGPRAALFHLQGGRARVRAGQTSLGMPSLKRGLRDEASEIETWLKTILPSMPAATVPEGASKSSALPTHCPACGAGIRPDEVEWLDELTAECAYCGSPVQAED